MSEAAKVEEMEALREERQALVDRLAAEAAEQGGGAPQDRAEEALAAWFDELEALAPVDSIKATYGGREFTIRSPKLGRVLAASKHLASVGAKANALGFEGGPLQLWVYLLHSWESLEFLGSFAEEVCALLDVLLGEEPGWVAEHLEMDELPALCRDFLRVARVDLLRRNFTGALGAAKGQAVAAGLVGARPASR